VRIAAEHYGWQKRTPAFAEQRDREVAVGRGMAFRKHGGPIVALIAEVRVHRNTGRIDIARLVCAHDSGLVINPGTLHDVIERQLVSGISRTLMEEVQFDHERVISVDWNTYPVMYIDSIPDKVDIVLIPNAEEPPTGAGGVAMGLLPAAIGNAIFDATGVRLRRVPFTPARVKEAMARA
jgi:nicotinate dehydrogenase subunit B